MIFFFIVLLGYDFLSGVGMLTAVCYIIGTPYCILHTPYCLALGKVVFTIKIYSKYINHHQFVRNQINRSSHNYYTIKYPIR